MKVTTERIDNHKITLEMQVPAAEVSKAFQKAYQKLAAKVAVPGFRKGKVPRKILEMRIGKEAFAEEAFDFLVPQAYAKALEQEKIVPVSRPAISIVTLEDGKDMVVKATVVEKPVAELGEYKGLKVKETIEEITDDKVDARLEEMRTRQAKMVVKEDATLENGDFAIIDFKGFVGDEAFEGGEGKAYPLEIGSGSFIPGFEEQLIGAKTGESRDVNVTFPADYHAENLAGKEARFEVKINDIKCKQLPALDDEFAKEASDFETLAEFKADIKKKMETDAQEKGEREYKAEVIKKAVENATVDIPDAMVEERINSMIEDLDLNLQQRGMQLDMYLKYTKMDMATLRKNYHDSAVYNVKADLVLEAVAKAENIEAAQADMDDEIKEMAEAYGASAEEVRKVIVEQGRMDSLKESVIRRKAYRVIIDNAEKEA